MKNVFSIRLLLIIAVILFASQEVRAQAFDGADDHRLSAGYSQIGSLSGVELGYEEGFNDYFSWGMQVTALFTGEKPDEDGKFLDAYDISFRLNFHWSEVFKLPSKFDVYTGISAGLKTVGLGCGARYHFSEHFGVYAAAHYAPFSTFTLGGSRIYYKGKPALSVGLTIGW